MKYYTNYLSKCLITATFAEAPGNLIVINDTKH